MSSDSNNLGSLIRKESLMSYLGGWGRLDGVHEVRLSVCIRISLKLKPYEAWAGHDSARSIFMVFRFSSDEM